MQENISQNVVVTSLSGCENLTVMQIAAVVKLPQIYNLRKLL